MEESQKLVSMVLLNLIKIDYEVKFSQLEFEVLSVSIDTCITHPNESMHDMHQA